ncbi:MAG: hypothetical protein U9R08_04985 [Nanoarchaeota archaeon]|nr:hypothetical protein [Nanoarchaeota archaeon]
MHNLSETCGKTMGALFLIIGILFLLVDLGSWTFYGIQWWTVLFLILGLVHIKGHGCPMCK